MGGNARVWRAGGLAALAAAAAVGAIAYFLLFAGSAGAASTTLFPSTDKTNTGGWTNDSGNICNGIISSICAARIDEDVDLPERRRLHPDAGRRRRCPD